jgi:hypothetical protein
VKPADYPISSPASRAAARLQIAQRNSSRKRVRLVCNVPRPGVDDSRVRFGGWQECQDGTLLQIAYVPRVWVKPGEAVPICPHCDTPFEKTHEYRGMVGFEANCMDEHDPEPRRILR